MVNGEPGLIVSLAAYLDGGAAGGVKREGLW